MFQEIIYPENKDQKLSLRSKKVIKIDGSIKLLEVRVPILSLRPNLYKFSEDLLSGMEIMINNKPIVSAKVLDSNKWFNVLFPDVLNKNITFGKDDLPKVSEFMLFNYIVFSKPSYKESFKGLYNAKYKEIIVTALNK